MFDVEHASVIMQGKKKRQVFSYLFKFSNSGRIFCKTKIKKNINTDL